MIQETSPTTHYEAFVQEIVDTRVSGSKTTGTVMLMIDNKVVTQKIYRSDKILHRILTTWDKMYRLRDKQGLSFNFVWNGHGIMTGQKLSRRIAYKSQTEVL